MKIAITSTGTELGSAVDPHFGRCPYLALVDLESGALEAVANPFLDAAGGAGTQAAQWVVDKGVGAVLTGHCGPKATAVLDDADVEIVNGVTGTVQEAVAGYRQGAKGGAPAHTESAPPSRGRGGGFGARAGRGPCHGGRRGPGGGHGPGRGGRAA